MVAKVKLLSVIGRSTIICDETEKFDPNTDSATVYRVKLVYCKLSKNPSLISVYDGNKIYILPVA